MDKWRDKSTWGKGPWQDEPDELEWRDDKTGLACRILRNPVMGNLNGYVGVPMNNPIYGKRYQDLSSLDVHGGVTYAGPEVDTTDVNLWWIGFDCMHAFDYGPAYYARNRQFKPFAEEKYKDIHYVKKQCTKLAAQLAAKPSCVGGNDDDDRSN